MSLILQPEELRAVTSFTQPQKQAQFIRDTYGIYAVVNPANECVVVRAHLEAAKSPEPIDDRPTIRKLHKRQ